VNFSFERDSAAGNSAGTLLQSSVKVNELFRGALGRAARRIGHHKTKKEAVTTALSEYIAHRKRLEILDLFGTVDFDPAYDYQAERRKKR